MSYFGLLCKTVGNPREGVSGKRHPEMSHGKESSTKNHLGYELQRTKGVWSRPNVKTLETAITVAGTVWEQGGLTSTTSGAVLIGASVFTQYLFIE